MARLRVRLHCEDLLDPADVVERPGERVLLRFGWIRQFAGLARSWSGASSPEPVIRLRQAGVSAAATGVFAVTGRLAIFGLASSRRQRDG